MRAPGIVMLAAPAELPPVRRAGQETNDTPPSERGQVDFLASGQHFACGSWEGACGELRLENYPVDEFCLLLSGEIVVTPVQGPAFTLRAGDSFVIPRGFCGTWTITATARKLFACAGKPARVAAITGLETPR